MLNKTLVPAILLIAFVIGGIFIYQDNKAISNLNNIVAKLQTGELPTTQCQVIDNQGKAFTTTTPTIACISYNFQLQRAMINNLNATSTKATNK